MWYRGYIQRRFDLWLEKRLPRVASAFLNTRSLFVFPSRAGLSFLLVIALLWLLATNYENNIVFALGALLGAMLVVAIFHSFANLAGLSVRVREFGNGFPGDLLKVEVELSQRNGRLRDNILLAFPESTPVQVALAKGDSSTVATLYVPARYRGKRRLQRLTVETTFPIGLVRTWTHILLEGYGVVYPRPMAGIPQAAGDEGESTGVEKAMSGHDDFAGLQAYRPGESPGRIAWKQLAREQGLFSKQFSEPPADPQWLDWQHYPGLDREARLSRLCFAVLESSRDSTPYGLRLPGYESTLGSGFAHRERLLTALALFEAGEG